MKPLIAALMLLGAAAHAQETPPVAGAKADVSADVEYAELEAKLKASVEESKRIRLQLKAIKAKARIAKLKAQLAELEAAETVQP